MKYYLITLKRNAVEFTAKRTLEDKYKDLFSDNSLCSSCELDSRYRLHLHGLVIFVGTPYYKRYQRAGWHVHFKYVLTEDDLPHVINYIYKNNNKSYQNEMEIISYSKYNYMFI